MKQIKRASALLLALLVALSAMAITAFAEGSPAIVVDGFDGETLTEGATVTLKVHYNDFLPFNGFTFLVDYDRDALELVDIGYSYEVVEGVSVPYIADGSYLMAFGPSVSLEVTAQPEKTAYQAEETFDPAGVRAELVYANGQRLDVTEYLLYSTDPLTTEDKAVTLRFPYVLYHDEDTGDGHTEGVRTQTPIVQVSITVSEGMEAPTVRYGDVNSDGIIDLQDVLLVQRYVAKRIDASRLTTAAADVNGDSIIDLQDMLLIQRYVAKRISRFPVE